MHNLRGGLMFNVLRGIFAKKGVTAPVASGAQVGGTCPSGAELWRAERPVVVKKELVSLVTGWERGKKNLPAYVNEFFTEIRYEFKGDPNGAQDVVKTLYEQGLVYNAALNVCGYRHPKLGTYTKVSSTLLGAAVYHDSEIIVRSLIAIDKELINASALHTPPLFIAVLRKNLPMVKLLCENGADTKILNQSGTTVDQFIEYLGDDSPEMRGIKDVIKNYAAVVEVAHSSVLAELQDDVENVDDEESENIISHNLFEGPLSDTNFAQMLGNNCNTAATIFSEI